MVLDALTNFFNSNNTNGILNCNINLHNTIIESIYSIKDTLFLELKKFVKASSTIVIMLVKI